MISRTQAEQDLDELEWHIEHRFSYRDRLGLDYRAALDTIRAGLAESVAVRSLTLQLIQVMALFGDGHSRLEVPSNFLLQSRFAPFLLADAKGGVVAFRPSRDGLLVEGHPYVVSIELGVERQRDDAAADRIRHRQLDARSTAIAGRATQRGGDGRTAAAASTRRNSATAPTLGHCG